MVLAFVKVQHGDNKKHYIVIIIIIHTGISNIIGIKYLINLNLANTVSTYTGAAP